MLLRPVVLIAVRMKTNNFHYCMYGCNLLHYTGMKRALGFITIAAHNSIKVKNRKGA